MTWEYINNDLGPILGPILAFCSLMAYFSLTMKFDRYRCWLCGHVHHFECEGGWKWDIEMNGCRGCSTKEYKKNSWASKCL